ncbi:hypothetical protein BDF22DRAFT_742072 [Syncephalis plumigaleata]|nr:hypothetical protein BDF22DRAFT_742072 [Syncephalis plumigaleata]
MTVVDTQLPEQALSQSVHTNSDITISAISDVQSTTTTTTTTTTPVTTIQKPVVESNNKDINNAETELDAELSINPDIANSKVNRCRRRTLTASSSCTIRSPLSQGYTFTQLTEEEEEGEEKDDKNCTKENNQGVEEARFDRPDHSLRRSNTHSSDGLATENNVVSYTSRYSIQSSRSAGRRASYASSRTYSLRDSWRTSWTSYTSGLALDHKDGTTAAATHQSGTTDTPLSPAARELLATFTPIRELDLTMSMEKELPVRKPAVSEALRRLNSGGDWSDDDEADLLKRASSAPGTPMDNSGLVDEIRRTGLPTESDAAKYRATQRAAPPSHKVDFPMPASPASSSSGHRSRTDSMDSVSSWQQHRPPTPTFRPPSVMPTLENADTASVYVPDHDVPSGLRGEDNSDLDTKSVFDDRQKIAYVGLCYLILAERYTGRSAAGQEKKAGWASAMNFSRQMLRKLYQHMGLSPEEQKMVENMSGHGVLPSDVARTLIIECKEVTLPAMEACEAPIMNNSEVDTLSNSNNSSNNDDDDGDDTGSIISATTPTVPSTPLKRSESISSTTSSSLKTKTHHATQSVASDVTTATTTTVAQTISMDVRWTIVADLFLLIISESQYDARARLLLKDITKILELDWNEFVQLERRVAEQLRINDEVAETMKHEIRDSEARNREGRGRRWALLGLATLGGGLMLGLSAGLLAPVIGAGLAAGFSGIGVAGTGAFLAHTGGVALITTGGVLTGGGLAGKKMFKRTRGIQVFQFHPLLDQKRVNVILCISGWLTCEEDVWLPFSVLDPGIGDQFCLCWEPKLLYELGSVLKILAGEVLSQAVQTALAHTVLATLMAGLAWPLALTKLGYLVDNPWSIGLDRARKAGLILADTLLHRNQGFRPVTLFGYSLGARVIFYCLVELARMHAFGIVEDVFLFGTPITAPREVWDDATSVVSGRFVNGYHQKDWVLGFLYRVGARHPVAGLSAIEGIRGLENIDVTNDVRGHLGYRVAVPRLLKKMGIPVTAEEFQEPETEEEREEREAAERLEVARKRQSELMNNELQQAMAELLASGCKVREIKSTLPVLGVAEEENEEEETKSDNDDEKADRNSVKSETIGKHGIMDRKSIDGVAQDDTVTIRPHTALA